MPRCLAPPCRLCLSYLPPHAIVGGLGLCLEFTFEVGRGAECMMPRRLVRPCPLPLYSLPAHAVVYCLKTVAESSCMMSRRLAQPCPLSIYALPAHPVVYGLCPLVITFEVVRGVELFDEAVSGTVVHAPPLLTACTRGGTLLSSCWIRRYPLLSLVAVLSVRCSGVWHGSARSLAHLYGCTLLPTDCTRRCVVGSRADSAVSAPFRDAV